MATGPQHYRKAEILIKVAEAPDVELGSDKERWYLTLAQIHATLALAAATALNGAADGLYLADHNAWHKVAGEDASAAVYTPPQRVTEPSFCTRHDSGPIPAGGECPECNPVDTGADRIAAAMERRRAKQEAEVAEEGASPRIIAPRPFAPGDVINVNDPGSKHTGLRGRVVGCYGDDPDNPLVVIEYDNLGNTKTFPASVLMHHADFLALDDPDGVLADVHSVHDVDAINRAAAEQAGGAR